MKKFLCVILSVVCMMLNFNVFAEMPSGLKNIEGTVEGSESININILGANQYKIIESNNVKVEVKVNLKADKSMPYTVEYFCGNKKYGTEQFVVAPNTQVTKEFVIAGVNQGIQNFTINVISGGQIKKSLSQEYSIVIPAKKEFMDFYPTRGYNGSYNNEQMQYYMKLQGVNSQRTGEEWNNLEKAPGEYNYSPFDSWNGAVKNMGINTVYLLCYNNPIYNGVSPLVNIMSRQIGPKTKEEFDAFAKYAADFAAKHPDIKYFEVYNEPNIAFWSPGPNVTDYTYLVEVTNREVKKVRPDASIVSGVVAGAQAKFIMDMYDRNVYAHTDSISYHPYIYPAKVDDIYQVSIDGIHDTILGNGGFKEPTITEIGWATHEGGTGSSEETQSIELVKQFVVADASGVEMNEVHHMKDTGLNKAYNEENFGVIHYDGTLKPSFITVKNFFDESKGAKYFGKLSLGEEIQAHLYLKNSQITAVVWTKGNDTSHTFEGENIKTYDINGNYISDSNTVNIKEEPVYIKGLNLNNLNRELYFNLKEMLTHQLKAVSSKIEKNELDAIEGVFNTALEPIKELENNDELLDEDSALKLMHDYYTTIKDGVNEIKLNDAMLSSVYYMAYLGGKTIGNYYMMCVDGENYEPKSESAIKALENKLGEGHHYPYTEAMIKFAKNSSNQAKAVSQLDEKNSMKAGIVKSWDELSLQTVGLAVAMNEKETLKNDDVLLQLPSAEAGVQTNVPTTVNLSMYNYTKDDLNGTLEFVSPEDKVLTSVENVTIKSGKNIKQPIKITVSELLSKAGSSYKFRFVQNNSVIKEVVAPIVIKVGVAAKFETIENTFDNMNELTLDLKNLSESDLNGTIEVTAPDGWSLSNGTQNIAVNKLGDKKIKFSINEKTKMPYNNYVFNVAIKNQAGNVVFEKKLPLNFSVIVKSKTAYDTSTFNGDITDFSDAYPIYFGNIKDVNSYTDWKEIDVSARTMAKWDENYLYVLADVYDNVHIQQRKSSQMWDGDSVQISLDTMNDKTNGYDGNDYEYGFSYSDENGNTSYSWQSAAGHAAGDKPSDWVKILRDEKTKLTRYLIRIPAKEVAPLSLTLGSSFGMNVAVNDADWGSRERLIENVPGTAAAKNPSVYPNFILYDSEEKSDKEQVVPIPSTMVIDETQKPDSGKLEFGDIKGHYAEESIKKFGDLGFVKGDENKNFNPESSITRAEFTSILDNIIGGKHDEYKKPYVDINDNDWFAKGVYNAKKANLIDGAMADVYFYPNSEILREECASMISRHLNLAPSPEANELIALFEDGTDVSDWAKQDVIKLCYTGILKGDNKRLNPKSMITRAEAVVLLDRMIEIKGN